MAGVAPERSVQKFCSIGHWWLIENVSLMGLGVRKTMAKAVVVSTAIGWFSALSAHQTHCRKWPKLATGMSTATSKIFAGLDAAHQLGLGSWLC